MTLADKDLFGGVAAVAVLVLVADLVIVVGSRGRSPYPMVTGVALGVGALVLLRWMLGRIHRQVMHDDSATMRQPPDSPPDGRRAQLGVGWFTIGLQLLMMISWLALLVILVSRGHPWGWAFLVPIPWHGWRIVRTARRAGSTGPRGGSAR